MNFGTHARTQFPLWDLYPKASYLDSAATTQKPRVVIERLTRFLSHENANIHRGAYALSGNATEMYEEARRTVAQFLGTSDPRTIVFTRGTTDSVNIIAQALAERLRGKTILLSLLEHHSHIVPWQIVAERVGARIAWVDAEPVTGVITVDAFKRALTTHTPALVAITQLSNALGTVTPLSEIISLSKNAGALVSVDGAQSVAHIRPLDVAALGCDFFSFSGHKLYGPTGIGVLYIAGKLGSELLPVQGGGGMIQFVTKQGSTWADAPQRFEAGTPPIAEAIALGAAISWFSALDHRVLDAHETEVLRYGAEQLSKQKGVSLYGPVAQSLDAIGVSQKACLSFTVDGVHPHDFATIADSVQVQVRAGHHCAMPLMEHLGLTATIRASVGVYSCREDFDALVEAVKRSRSMFLR
jgi:cysteine desulfurase/selenocysteine lyase